MILLTPEIRARLRANADAHTVAQGEGRRSPDPVPMLKLFNPLGAATWLFTELDADGLLFGLCDLGFGTPELGYASLAEIHAVRLPWGLRIERDLCFRARFPLSLYAEAARIVGRIIEDESLLATLARARGLLAGPDIPPASDG